MFLDSFLDEYHPDVVPNTSDDEGRYMFDQQPTVAQQNLQYLSQALTPILEPDQWVKLNKMVGSWEKMYKKEHVKEMRKKLGLEKTMVDDPRDGYMVRVSKIMFWLYNPNS